MLFDQELTPEQICNAIVSSNSLLFPDMDDVAKLIRLLDVEMADYEFTQNMARYFIAECMNGCDETDPFDINELLPSQ